MVFLNRESFFPRKFLPLKYLLDLPMPTSFCLCLLPMPISSAFCLFPCPAYFLALPISSLFPCPAYFLLPFLALPVSLPCLIPCPSYYLDLSMPTSFCLCLLLCLFPLPVSLPCLLLCPAYFLSLPFSLPCLLPCPTYRSTLFYECMLHGYIASLSLLIAFVCIYVPSSVDTLTLLFIFFLNYEQLLKFK